MLTKNDLVKGLFCLLLLISAKDQVFGQTGGAYGEIQLCSKGVAVQDEVDIQNVQILAVRNPSNLSKPYPWDRCKRNEKDCDPCEGLGNDCKPQFVVNTDGKFDFQGLLTGPWIFMPLSPSYSLDSDSLKKILIGITIVQDSETQIKPPKPMWLRSPRRQLCPDEKKKADSGVRNSSNVATSEDNGGASPLVFVLYKREQDDSISSSKQKKEINLKGRVEDTLGNRLDHYRVLVSDLNPTGDDPAVLVDSLIEVREFNFTITVDLEEKVYIFSVELPGFNTLLLDLEDAIEMMSRDKPLVLKREGELKGNETILTEAKEATRRHVFLPEVMQTLPLPGTRSFDEFALLAPGVLPPPETFGRSGPGISPTAGTAGQFSVNGLRSRENNFTIDGSDNNDEDIGTRRQGFIMTVPQPVESVQELQVITALGGTRFGRNIGGQINVLTKTGGRGTSHGTFYSFINNARLNARDPFDKLGKRDRFTRVQIGLAAGGRLTEDRDTSYFVSAERQDVRADREAHFAVPTLKQRGAFDSGDTGLLLVNGPNVKTPLFPASVPGNAIFSLFPLPNNPLGPYGENTYSNVLPADGHGWRFSVKLGRDFQGEPPSGPWWRTPFTRKAHIDQITARYNLTDEFSTLPVTGGALFSSLRPKIRTQNLAGFINRSLSSSTTDTIRISFGRTRLSFGERLDASMLPSAALPNTPFLLNAPLVLNLTKPNADGSLNTPSLISASSPAGSAVLNSLGYSGVTQTEQITGPLGQVFIGGFSPIGVDVENFPQLRSNNTYQIADTFTSVRNAHIFTFGADIRKTRINSTLDRNFRPRATFHSLSSGPFAGVIERPGFGPIQDGQLTGLTLAAAGVPTGLFQTFATVPDSSVGLTFSQFNFFLQDQWRLHPRFYLTAGLRYELNSAPDTVGLKLETAFDPQELRTLAERASQFCQPNARCSDLVSSLTAAFPADFKLSFIADRNDVDPRVGFAWTVSKSGNTVLRGGFGAYSGQFPTMVLSQVRNAFPAFLPLNFANFTPRSGDRTFLFNLANPAVQQLLPSPPGIPTGFTAGTLNEISTINSVAFLVNQGFNLQNLSLSPTVFGLDLVLPQRELKPPYSLHYALTLEHQFHDDYMVSAAYVGTRGNKLLRLATPDLGLNNTRFAGNIVTSPLNGSQPFPDFRGQILPPQTGVISQSFAIARTFYESSAESAYNSLQVEVRKRYSKHFLFGSAFTYSHSIDDASDFFDNAGAYSLPQNSVVRSERGSSNFDIRIRSATHFVVDLQRDWFAKKGWRRRVLGGLQLAGIFTAQGGQPYTVNSAFDINRDGNLTDRLNTLEGLILDSTDDRVQLRLEPGVNTRDLLAADGFDGSIGRNTFRAPHFYNFDFAVTRRITLGERKRFLIRAEFLNMFNWANYGIPVRILEQPGFGTAVRTLTPARTIQLVGKFQF